MLSLGKGISLGLLTVFSGSIVLAATSPSTEQPQRQQAAIQQPSQQKVDGGQIYAENCSICHGDNGDANTRASGSLRPPPRNFTTINAALELSRERMINSVTNGRPGTGMMPHKDRLSTQEIAAVVDYIRANFMKFPQHTDKKQFAKHAAGEKIYAKNCSVCHGDKGTTAIWARGGLNPQPRDFTTAKARQELTRERMINSVTNGRPGTAMMPHKERLSAKEITQVVDYIRATFMQNPATADAQQTQRAAPSASQGAASQPMQGHPQMPGFSAPGAAAPASASGAYANAPHAMPPHQGPHDGGMPAMNAAPEPVVSVDMTVPMPKGLKANIAKGREFYMHNCFTCHGVKGDGKGPRASFNTPRPRNFTSEASRMVLNRERLFNSITHGRVGTVMPAWGKVLNDQQIANVAEFVFTAFIQAKGAAAAKASSQQVSLNKKKAN